LEEDMIKKLTQLGLYGSCAAGIFMVFVTFIDVIGSKLFKSPLTASYELVSLSQVLAIGLIGADGFLNRRHVTVDLFVDKMPKPLRKAVILGVTALSIFLFFIMTVEGFLYGESLRQARETSGTVNIPLFPFGYSLGVSFLFLFLVLVKYFIATLRNKEV